MADRIRLQASLAIMLVDDFTGHVITGGGIRVYVEGMPPPIHKPDGCYVFVGLPKSPVVVRTESRMYDPRIAAIDLSGGFVLRRLRLFPSRDYRLPSGAVCIEGRAEPGSRICLFRKGGKAMKLLCDYPGGGADKISIRFPRGGDMEGSFLRIQESGGESEFFRLGVCIGEEGVYRLEEPLSRGYKKDKTTLRAVRIARADEDGRFHLSFLEKEEEPLPYCFEAQGEHIMSQERVLGRGSISRVDLRERKE